MIGNRLEVERTMAQAQYVSTACTAVPKEIGWLQRVEGLRCSLDEIHGQLQSFADRLAAIPPRDSKPEPPPIGLPGNIATSEDRIRSILNLLAQLENAF